MSESLTPRDLVAWLGFKTTILEDPAVHKATKEFLTECTTTGNPPLTLKKLLVGLNFSKKSPAGTYQKLLEADAPIPTGEKSIQFLTEGNALWIMCTTSQADLEQRWEKNDIGSLVQSRSITEEFLGIMALSPLAPRLRLVQDLAAAVAVSLTPPRPQARVDLTELTDANTSADSGSDVSFDNEASFSPIATSSPAPSAAAMESPEKSKKVEKEKKVGVIDLVLDEKDVIILSSDEENEGNLPDLNESTRSVDTSVVVGDDSVINPTARECIDIILRHQLDPTFLNDVRQVLRSRELVKKDLFKGSFSRSLKICSWNTRAMSMLGKPNVRQDALLHELSYCDIICLQEVPYSKSNQSERVEALCQKLNSLKNLTFKWHLSSASGMDDSSKKEVHAILYSTESTLSNHFTLSSHGTILFDYAPFVAKLTNPQFPKFVFFFTSVHFPPEGRKDKQRAEIQHFSLAYEFCIREHFKEAMTAKGASDAKKMCPVHIVMGDFNAVPAFEGFSNTWGERLKDVVKTSSVGRAFDHFYLSDDSLKEFGTDSRVRYLNFGEEQLSDHSPVILKLTKLPASKKS